MRFGYVSGDSATHRMNQAALSSSQPVLCFIVPDKPRIAALEGGSGLVEFSERRQETHARRLRALDLLHLGIRRWSASMA